MLMIMCLATSIPLLRPPRAAQSKGQQMDGKMNILNKKFD
jgi:hypothetical protein